MESYITYHRECSAPDDSVIIPSDLLSDEIKDKYAECNPSNPLMPQYVKLAYNGYYGFISVGNDRIDYTRTV